MTARRWGRWMTALVTGAALASSGCISLMFRPHKVSLEDIYQWEVDHYPSSGWRYLGYRGRFHYFSPAGKSQSGSYSITLSDWKLPKKHLPDITGFPYESGEHSTRSADVEIHASFIRIHIDGEEPVEIPFESRGFITAEHRPVGNPPPPEEPYVPLAERARKAAAETSAERKQWEVPNSSGIEVP